MTAWVEALARLGGFFLNVDPLALIVLAGWRPGPIVDVKN